MHLPHNWYNHNSFIWGAGIDLRTASASPYGQNIADDGSMRQSIGLRDMKGYGMILRAGVSFKSHLYITGSFAFGGFTSEKDIYSMSYTPTGLHYEGYDIGSDDYLYYCLNLSLGYRF